MNLKDVSLSLYSFGYSAGLIQEERAEASAPRVTLENLPQLAERCGLGGIEFPIDRCYQRHELERAEAWIAGVRRRGMAVAIDVETFDVPFIRALLPALSRNGLGFARVKMSTWYGGNRYLEPEFERQVAAFIEGLRVLLPELRRWRVKLLIENHQDLGANDLLRILEATSMESIGINWDIGNSVAVLDTPEMFLRKAGGFIGNTHLKDYRLFRCERGVYLCRCALGDGVVAFEALLRQLRRQRGPVPMAIELGAQHARRADVFTPAYWDAYPDHPTSERTEFLSWLQRSVRPGEYKKSPWEQQQAGEVIVASEMDELERSVAFLKTLELGDG